MTTPADNFSGNSADIARGKVVESSCGAVTNEAASVFTMDQHCVILTLQKALRDSTLLEELSNYRSQSFNQAVDHPLDGKPVEAAEKNLVFSLNRSARWYTHSLRKVKLIQAQVLIELDLHNIVSNRFWNSLLEADPESRLGRNLIDNALGKLLQIQQYRPVLETANHDASRSHTAETSDHTVTGFVTGLLSAVFIVVLSMQALPVIWDKFSHWSSSNVVLYKTIMLLALMLLVVLLFKLITYVFVPSRTTDTDGEQDVEPVTRLLSLNASRGRILAGCLGPILLGFGTGLSATAGLGAFSVTLMLDGFYQTYGTPFWLSQIVFTVLCLVFGWYFGRIPLGIGTLPALFLIGPFVSLGATFSPQDLSLLGNSTVFAIGTLVYAFGISLSAAAALGVDGHTALFLAAEKRSNWSIAQASLFFTVSVITIGCLLGGNFGIATILNMLALPTLLKFMIPALRRFLHNSEHPENAVKKLDGSCVGGAV